MEFVKQYWWVFLGGLLLLFVLGRGSQAAGPTVSQIGGTDSAGLALASLDVQAEQSRRQDAFGLIGGLLNFDLSNKQLEAGERVAIRQAEASEVIAEHQNLLQQQQLNQQYAYQNAALNYQNAANIRNQQIYEQYLDSINARNRLNNIGQLVSGGLSTFLPLFSGQGGGNGGVYTTPPFNPNNQQQGGGSIWGNIGTAIGSIFGGLFG